MLSRLISYAHRLALGLGLSLACTLPGLGCELMPAGTVAERLAQADRYGFDGGSMVPFIVLWQTHGLKPLASLPDHVAVFAIPQRPLIVAFERNGCILGLLPVARDEVWSTMRRLLGDVA